MLRDTADPLIIIRLGRSRRFDWPAFLRALGNRPDKSPLIEPRRSRTQRAFVKPRSTSPSSVHITPDLLRFAAGFRNARSVRFNFHEMNCHRAGKFGNHVGRLMRKIPQEGSHDLCEFESGRLTPWIFKVRLSAKWSRFKREMSAPLSGLLAVAVSSPRSRPQSVQARILTVTMSGPCPHPVRDRDRSLSVAAHSPLPRRVRKYIRVQSVT